MDELLSFMEEALSDEEGVDVSQSQSASSASSGKKASQSSATSSTSGVEKKKKKDLTFTDIFGSPDKRDLKDLGLAKPTASSSSSSSSKCSKRLSLGGTTAPVPSHASRPSLPSSSGLSQEELLRAIRSDPNVPHKPENSVVIDPYSRVRVLKNSISIYFDESMTAEAVLKDRNIGLEFVNLPTFNVWYKGKGRDVKNFWISGVLAKKTSGVRKSAKGNDYSIWELCDLRDLEKKTKVFLFGSSSSSAELCAIRVGSLVDITSPSVLHDSANGTSKFSINNGSQVRLIATSKDFGICQAIKKDGNKCTAIVNMWECSFCIHHASSELKKLNIGLKKGNKGKGQPNNGNNFPNKSFSGGESQESLKQQGIVIAEFGANPFLFPYGMKPTKSIAASTSAPPARPGLVPNSRMELQGPTSEMKKNPMKFGNSDTITFVKNENHHLFKNEPVKKPTRKPLDLNPTKTKHLTDKDRDLLLMLEGKSVSASTPAPQKETQSENKPSKAATTGTSGAVSDMITSAIVTNPNAASRNFLQFLQLQHAPKDQVDLLSANKSTSLEPIIMSREKIKSMQKALAFVKTNGPIKKADPNSAPGRKRKFEQLSQNEASGVEPQQGPSSKKRSGKGGAKIDVEFDFESDEFKKILNAKSAHDDELDSIQHEEYFGKLEKKEALENKLLSTFSIETNAVMCRQCKYVALSQSDFCKELMHEIRVVKAKKRFFKCKDCGNRTMSLDRLPKRPCSNCNNSSWLAAPVGKERKGPTLPSEMLSLRGNEEKFVGSAGSKMFLHLEV